MPRPRKYSGPLRPGTKSTRTYVAKKPRGGLNKVEKVQTKKIAEAVVKKEHALKSFDIAISDQALAPRVSVNPLALKQVSVIGYSSTVNTTPDGSILKYGPQNLESLFLARPFQWVDKDDASFNSNLTPQSMNGQYVLPKVARTNFSIERVRYAVDDGSDLAAGELDPLSGFTLPICCRMIKFTFKNTAGTTVIQNPNVDLFLDQHSNPIGIDSSATADTNGFDRMDARYAKVNKKLYNVESDTQFTLQQNNILTPNQVTSAKSSEIVTQKSGASFRHVTCPFQLSARKNSKLFYEGGKQTLVDNPTSGIKRTIVAYHFWYENGHLLLGGTGQPLAPGSINEDGEAGHAVPDIQIKYRNIAAFVDAQ